MYWLLWLESWRTIYPLWPVITAFACMLLTLPTLRKTLLRRRQMAYKDGTIYVHMFPRKFTKKVVNLSPFAIKLETWLRMKHIPYEVVETTRYSKSTRQIPYIILDGQEYADSDLIIQMLTERRGLDPTEGLSTEEQAVSRAFDKMLDENTAWTYLLHRYVFYVDKFAKYFRIGLPWPLYRLLPWLMKRKIRNGLRRKGPELVGEIGIGDIRAVSLFLGNKTFLFGDSPSKTDCTVFGHLSQVLYPDMPYPHKDFINTQCPNIVRYMERMRTSYWPDWDSLVELGTFQ